MHRRKVEGYSRDQMRAFADNMQHAAHHIARIRHADKMTAAVESVLAESRMLDKDANGDAFVDLHNELVKRLEIGYTWYGASARRSHPARWYA